MKQGVTFTEALQLAFIILKLCGVITWSWWWVMSPTLIGVGIVLVVLFIALIFWVVGSLLERKQRKNP